jgi:hypothetical protein
MTGRVPWERPEVLPVAQECVTCGRGPHPNSFHAYRTWAELEPTPIHDQLRRELAVRALPEEVLARIREDQASLDWHDGWRAQRE